MHVCIYFDITGFSNTLLSYHQEFESMKAEVYKHSQVCGLVGMILHEKTKGRAAEIVATEKMQRKVFVISWPRLENALRYLVH